VQKQTTQEGHGQDAVHDTDQPDVQPHVAVEDVAELVGHDALQLVAIQVLQGALRYGYHGVARGVAGGKSVNARLVGQHVHARHGHARGNGHFLDDIQQPLLARQLGLVKDLSAAHHHRYRGPAGGQLADLHGAGPADQQQHGDGHDQKDFRDPQVPESKCLLFGHEHAGKNDHHQPISQQDQRYDGEDEKEDQPPGFPPGHFLAFEEVRCHLGCCLA